MIWTYIKADAFFKDFCSEVRSHKHKIRRKNGRGNPTEFSKKEREVIRKALKKMIKNDL